MLQFQKAVKYGSKLRMALIGTSGSGKTYSALSIASHLGDRVAFIDTERGSARKYSDVFSFDVLELESFAVERYLEAIKAAEQSGYDVLIIDSLSHAWSGKDGLLEFVDMEKAKSASKNAFTDGWRKATPLHNSLIDAILGSRMHVIVCMRSKTEYVMQEDPRTGKKAPVKIGMQPVQREGMEYEFDVIGDMNMDHNLIVGKTRCRDIDGKVYPLPGKDLADILNAWLGGEAAPAAPAIPTPSPAPQPVPTLTAQPAPEAPELTVARDRVKEQLTKMMKMEMLDADAIRAELQALMGVDHLSKVKDIDSLNAYYDNLVKRCASDAPFNSPAPLTPEPAKDPEPVQQQEPEKPKRARVSQKCKECGMVGGHAGTCSLVNVELPAAPVNMVIDPKDREETANYVAAYLSGHKTESISNHELCMSLLETLDNEIQNRAVPLEIAETWCIAAQKKADEGKADSIQVYIDAAKGYPGKPTVAPDGVKNLQDQVKSLIQKMVNEDIDGFAQSIRMSNSVKLHLETKSVAECADVEKLTNYITHLHAIIANHTTKENIA